MNPADAVIQALSGCKESERQYDFDFVTDEAGGPYDVSVAHNGLVVQVEAEDTGRYGLMLRKIRLGANGGEEPSMRLRRARQSELVLALSTRVATPYGPLGCVEADAEAGEAVLRTHQVGEDQSYYETVVRSGAEVEVTHYSVPAQPRAREATPVNMGMEMFRVMLADLIDAALAVEN